MAKPEELLIDPDADEFGTERTEAKPNQPTQPHTRQDRGISNLISSQLEVDTVIRYLASAELGHVRYQYEMFDRMIERDAHLAAVLQTRRQALTQSPWSIVPGDEDDSRSVDAAEMIRQELIQYDGFDDGMQSLLDAVPKGTAVSEIMYTNDWGLDSLVEIPGNLYDWTDSELKIMTDGYKAEPMTPNKYIRHSPRLKAGPIQRRGIMRALSIYWVIAHYALEDWAAFTEVFGMPLRVGKYDSTNTQTGYIDILKTALKNLGTDASAVIPNDMDIMFMEPQRTSLPGNVSPMQQIIDHIEKKMSIAVLGQNLTTQSESGSGTLAGNAAERVQRSLTRGDAQQLNITLRRDLFRPIVGFRMGFDVALPHIVWDLDDPVDTTARGEVYKLGQELGVELSTSQFREEMGLREPLDDEDTLAAPQPRAGGFFTAKRHTRANLAEGAGHDTVIDANEANDDIAAKAAEDDDLAASVVKRVADMSKSANSPKALLASITGAAGNVEDFLGIDLDKPTDLNARASTTGDLNARVAVDDELEDGR